MGAGCQGVGSFPPLWIRSLGGSRAGGGGGGLAARLGAGSPLALAACCWRSKVCSSYHADGLVFCWLTSQRVAHGHGAPVLIRAVADGPRW
jgi:hypothetical protein